MSQKPGERRQEIALLTPTDLEQLVRDTWEAARREAAAPEVLTADECAELLRVSRKTITTYVEQRGLPAHRLGQEFRFRRSEILDWLSKQPTKGAA